MNKQPGQNGRGSNLTQEDRAKGGRHSHDSKSHSKEVKSSEVTHSSRKGSGTHHSK